MATLRTLTILLAAAFVTVLSQATSKRESLNFLQQANSFDPENLNEEEGFYYPEESELPNGDNQIVYNGPEGREACVVCQRSSTNDDMAASLRRLQIDVELLKKKLDSQDGPATKDAPKISILPAPAPGETPKISLLPAPAPIDAPKISILPAPAPEEVPENSTLPEPVPEPLLPEENPNEMLKVISGLDLKSIDPSMKEALEEVKNCLNKRTKATDQPITAEDKEKQDKELIDAKSKCQKQIENEKNPERKRVLLELMQRIQGFVSKTILIERKITSVKVVSRGSVSSRGKIIKFEADGSGNLPDLSQLIADATADLKKQLAEQKQTLLQPAEAGKKDKP